MSVTSAAAPAPTRRERHREQTVAEIKRVAREHLIAHGPQGVQLRAVARDVGMTAPALYRYFDSLEDLLTALVTDLYVELAVAVEEATAPSRGSLEQRLIGAARAFRSWSIAHPAEFGLLFGSPIPGVDRQDDSPHCVAAQRFGQAFGVLFVEIWMTRPYPVSDDLDPQLRANLTAYGDHVGLPLPPEAVAVFLTSWVRLYGAVTMEVFGHISFALDDAEPLFEAELVGLRRALGFV